MLAELVDHFIGAQRPMTDKQSLQHLATDGREFLTALGANGLGLAQRVGSAATMIMIGCRKNLLRLCHRKLI
jgi:hypothetical protein